MRYLSIYGLVVILFASGWRSVHLSYKNRNISVLATGRQRCRTAGIYSNIQDTVAIPDDTVPKIVLPAGTIEVATKSLKPGNREVKTLNCSSYNHDDFVSAKSRNLKWKGLFEAKGRFYIANTKLRLNREHSELDDEPSQKTGWLVSCDNKDQNILLISGAKNILNRPVKKALPSTKLYYAGQVLEFKYYGVKYTLYTTGFKKNGKVYNYKLFLLAKVKGRYFNQLLERLAPDETFGGEGEMSTDIDFEFAGDLDGDKIPDFIITESGFPFGFSYLLLSKSAGKKAILKMVSFNGDTD